MYKKKNVVCSMIIILSSIMCVLNKFKRKQKKNEQIICIENEKFWSNTLSEFDVDRGQINFAFFS